MRAPKPLLSCNSTMVTDAMGLFVGLDVGAVLRIDWHEIDNPGKNGRIWTARAADGVDWVSDGAERMAALPSRIFRFFRQGVTARCQRLAGKYLQGLVPIPEGAVIINIGANIGELAVTFARQHAHVLAIEPDPNVLPLLRRNASGLSIDVIPGAAWNTDGRLAMRLQSATADTSAFALSGEPTTVDAIRIDTLMRRRAIGPVHLLIGDAEGAEPEVLEGARQTLAMTDYVSLRASAERNGERTLEACESLLKAAGFNILHREDGGFCTLIAKAWHNGKG